MQEFSTTMCGFSTEGYLVQYKYVNSVRCVDTCNIVAAVMDCSEIMCVVAVSGCVALLPVGWLLPLSCDESEL